MALLPPQQNQEDEKDKPQAQQPVQPQQQAKPTQVQPMQSNIQPQQKQPAKTGSGFTNLNRIMQANTGSKLGSTVSGGIVGQVQNTQKGIQTAQQRFEDQAQKARLDTDEAAQNRSNILNRFDPSTYNIDESKFQISQPLQSKYEADKSTLGTNLSNYGSQLADYGARQSELLGSVNRNKELDSQLAEITKQMRRINRDATTIHSASSIVGNKQYTPSQKAQLLELQNTMNTLTAEKKNLESNLSEYADLSKNIESTKATQSSDQDRLQKLEKDFLEASNLEKQSFIESERQRILGEMVPTDQEISDFTKYRTGTYTGPAELEDATSLYGKAAQTEALGQLARSTGGREELLKRFVGGKDYTSGQRLLDTAILGQDRESGLGDAARQTRGTVSDVERANTTASQRAQEFAGRAKEFGAETSRMIGEKRDPISGEIDTQLENLRGQEKERLDNIKYLEDLFTGNIADYALLDKNTRLGLGLETARGLGYLSDSDVNQMLGQGGLIERAGNLGLDINKLIQDRIQSNIAQGMTRSGAATETQEASIRALDRLAGKVGPDVEFGGQLDEYQAGRVGFDLDSLNKYITQTEQEKAARDSRYADELAAERARYLNQALAGGLGAVQGSQELLGGALGQTLAPLDPKTLLDPEAYLQNYTNMIQGVGNMGLGSVQASQQGQNAILEGLTKLNIGGQSIANTPAGQQLLKAIELKSKLENEALGVGNQFLGSVTGGLNDLTRGNIGGAIGQLSGFNLAKDLTKSVSSNVAREISSAAKKAEQAIASVFCFAAGTKILMEDGSYKNVEDLKLDDMVAVGGKVVTKGEGSADELYSYNGVKVTGTHAVLENGKWLRVQDSNKSYPIGKDGIVYPVITEDHILVTKGQVWADLLEVDDIDGKTREEIIEELNSNVYRNKLLTDFQNNFFNKNANSKISKK